MPLVTLILLIFVLLSSVLCQEWDTDYNSTIGPPHWGLHYPACNGKRQSPINIETSKVVVNKSLTAFNFHLNLSNKSFILRNSGHTIMASPIAHNNTISGGGLAYKYTFANLHLHWGTQPKHNAEHDVDKKGYDAEVHLVHYNSDKYSNVSIALNHEDGIAVLGFLVKISTSSSQVVNPFINSILDNLHKIPHINDTTTLSDVSLLSLLPDDKTYFRYFGSLTIPSCHEVVTWTVFKEPIYVSKEKLIRLSQLRDGFGHNTWEKNSLRYVQPLNNRTVYVSSKSNSLNGAVILLSQILFMSLFTYFK